MPAGAPRLITALHVASYHNQEDMVQLLLDKGIKVGGVTTADQVNFFQFIC